MMGIIEKRVNRIYRSILVLLSVIGVAISYSSSIGSDIFVIVCAMKSISIMVFIAGFWFVGRIVVEGTIDGYKKKLQTVKITNLIVILSIGRYLYVKYSDKTVENIFLLFFFFLVILDNAFQVHNVS